MKRLFISIFLTASFVSSAWAIQINSLSISVLNTTNQSGFFGICVGPIAPEKRTLCSIPQLIPAGHSQVLVPPYSTIYPVFATGNNHAYSCVGIKDRSRQIGFDLKMVAANILVIDSFVKNSDGNIVAVQCELIKK